MADDGANVGWQDCGSGMVISLCVLFSAYCIVLLSFVLAMLKWFVPTLAIQFSYSFMWCLLFFYYFKL